MLGSGIWSNVNAADPPDPAIWVARVGVSHDPTLLVLVLVVERDPGGVHRPGAIGGRIGRTVHVHRWLDARQAEALLTLPVEQLEQTPHAQRAALYDRGIGRGSNRTIGAHRSCSNADAHHCGGRSQHRSPIRPTARLRLANLRHRYSRRSQLIKIVNRTVSPVAREINCPQRTTADVNADVIPRS
jgi:hypothetical protein